jgi:hypothetical protein
MKKIMLLYLACMLLGTACTSSRITTSWKAPGTNTRGYNKILVLGLIQDKDRSLQQKMEQHLTGDLANLGYKAISALDEYGPKTFTNMDEKQALEKIKNSGVDAVLTIMLLDKEKERNYIHAHSAYYGPFWGYYGSRYRMIIEPGYYVTDTKYFWESNFYDMSTQALLYSVQTKSFNPANTENLGHEYGKLIVNNMLAKGVLQESGKRAKSSN